MSVALLLLLRKIIFKRAWVRIEGKGLPWKIPAPEPWKKTRAQHRMRAPTLEVSDCTALRVCNLRSPCTGEGLFASYKISLLQSGLAGERGASIEHLAFTYEKNISAPFSGESKRIKKKIKKIKITSYLASQ